MPLPRMNLAGDACCEPCIAPCGTCNTGDCVEVGLMIQFREVHDYKCGWPALSSAAPDDPDPSDNRRWHTLTMRFENHYSLEITGPVGPCTPYVGTTYTADLNVTAVWNSSDPPFGGSAPCFATAGLSVTAGYTFTDSEAGSGSITRDGSPDLPTYDGYGAAAGLEGLFDLDGPDFFFATGCDRAVTLTSTIGDPDHDLWTGDDTRTLSKTANPPDTHGHVCNIDCTSTNESEFTLSDVFTDAELIANVQDEMDAEIPGGTSFFEAFAWLGTDSTHGAGGDGLSLYCSGHWLEYSFFLTPPVGQDATVTWDVKKYAATSEGVAGTLLSTTPMSELNPDGTVSYDLHPPIGGSNEVWKVENIVVTCTPA